MSYNLYLDDLRVPYDTFNYSKDSRYTKLKWVIVRSYKEFVRAVETLGIPNLVSFDHDLADEHYDTLGQTDFLSLSEYYLSNDREMTGYDCAKWLCDYCIDNNEKFPNYLIHSWNRIGSENIKGYITNFIKHNN